MLTLLKDALPLAILFLLGGGGVSSSQYLMLFVRIMSGNYEFKIEI